MRFGLTVRNLFLWRLTCSMRDDALVQNDRNGVADGVLQFGGGPDQP